MPRGSGRGFQPQRGSSPRRRPFARACSDTRGDPPPGWIWKKIDCPWPRLGETNPRSNLVDQPK